MDLLLNLSPHSEFYIFCANVAVSLELLRTRNGGWRQTPHEELGGNVFHAPHNIRLNQLIVVGAGVRLNSQRRFGFTIRVKRTVENSRFIGWSIRTPPRAS